MVIIVYYVKFEGIYTGSSMQGELGRLKHNSGKRKRKSKISEKKVLTTKEIKLYYRIGSF